MENRDFLYLFNFLRIAKHPYLLGFEHQEHVRTLSFAKMLQNALVNVSNGRLELEL